MFEALRRMILPIIIIVLVFFMGMIVLQWGLDLSGSRQAAQANLAGVINGEEISWNMFQSVYSNLYQTELQNYEEEIPDSRLQELEQQTWNEIVQDRLLMQEAEKHNVVVSSDDVYLYLKLSPPQYLQQATAFQTDGQFDYQKYLNYMADPQAASLWAQIEPQVRADLKKLKVQQLVLETINITEADVKQSFLDGEEKVQVGMINCGSAKFFSAIPRPTEEELQVYFEANREKYTTGERVVISIVKSSKEPNEYDWEIARVLAQELLDSIKGGADFAELASEWSKDPGSAAKGGDLGWFAPGRMVESFDSASFAMSEGDLSNPIRTQFGWHVLKHHGYKEEKEIPPGGDKEKKVRKAHVSHILIKAEISTETLDRAWQQMDEFHALFQKKEFQEAASELELEVHTTDPTHRNSNIPYLSGAPKVLEWAFEGTPGDISEVMETGAAYCVVRIDERLPEGLAEFEEVKARVGQELHLENVTAFCRDTARVVYGAIQEGLSLKKAAEQFGLEYETPDAFGRSTRLDNFGADPVPIGAAFTLSEPGQVSDLIGYASGAVVFELIEKVSPDLSTFNEKRDSIFDAVKMTKQQQVYSRWFEQVISSAEIASNVGIPQQAR